MSGPARELVEEVLRTGLALTDALGFLIDALPPDAFRGEDSGEVLIEMTAGSCADAVESAGETQCRETIALLTALRECFLRDLRAAAELARSTAET